MAESADHIVKLCPFLNAPCLGDACINHNFVEGHIGFGGRWEAAYHICDYFNKVIPMPVIEDDEELESDSEGNI